MHWDETVLPRILVLGIGNLLLQDEGLGVRAIERLSVQYRLPEWVQVMDGGTMGLDLLPYLEDIPSLIIIDAVCTGQCPGSIVRLAGEEIPVALAHKFSLHQVGLHELLATSRLRGTLPSRLVLWGMEPASLEWGLTLSPPIAARLDDLVDAVIRELRGWGVAVPSQNRQATASANSPAVGGTANVIA